MEARSQLRHRPTRRVFSIFSYRLTFVKWMNPIGKESGNCTAPAGIDPMDMLVDMLAPSRTRQTAGWLSILLVCALTATAQPGSPAPSSEAAAAARVSVSNMLQPAIGEVQHSLSSVNISKWKAPGEVRNIAQQNSASIQRDLTDTLPGLLSQADVAPGAVSPSFAVYRNIDALYDVLLRVCQTASLAAPDNEANSLVSALQKLDSARRQLGDTILADSQAHEAQLIQLQAALKAASEAHAAAPASAKTSVVEDGPAPAAPRKKKKPAAKPPASSTTQSPPSQTP
jgi:hypothetical protein